MLSLGSATSGYFSALGVPLVGGRPFEEADDDGASGNVVVLSEAAARFLLPDTDSVGQTLPLRLPPIAGQDGEARVRGEWGHPRGQTGDQSKASGILPGNELDGRCG